jgi:hypothetical protein
MVCQYGKSTMRRALHDSEYMVYSEYSEHDEEGTGGRREEGVRGRAR